MPTKNLRHGRIRLFSGDTPVRLEKTAAFTEGDFSFTRNKTTIQVKDRGKLSHLRRGDQEPVSFSFSAKFVDKTLRRTLESHIWDGITDTLEGLTPQAANTPELTYAYEQDSLEAAAGEAIATKLANGAAVTGDDEFSEVVGAVDEEGDIVEVRPATINVRPGAADTTMDVVFDAVGLSTLDPRGVSPPRCAADAKTFLIILEKMVVAMVEDEVDETYELNHAYIETVEQAEGDEYDTLSFNGMAYVKKYTVNELLSVGASQDIHEVVLSDAVFVTDTLPDGDVVISQ